jgi:hypothetical protein
LRPAATHQRTSNEEQKERDQQGEHNQKDGQCIALSRRRGEVLRDSRGNEQHEQDGKYWQRVGSHGMRH